MAIQFKIDVDALLGLLDSYSGGDLYGKMKEDDTIESVRMVGYSEVEFTIGKED